MTAVFTKSSETDSGVKQSGEDKISIDRETKNWNADGTSEMVREMGGPKDQINEFYNEQKTGGINLASMSNVLEKGLRRLTQTFQTDNPENPEDGEPEDPDAEETTIPEWTLELLEVPYPLASHPYFQLTYFPASGYTIEQEIAKADLAIAAGRVYAPDATYGAYVKRYYAMRMAGIEVYNAPGLQLSKSYVTFDEAKVAEAYTNIGAIELIANIAPPSIVEAAMDAVEKITSYTTASPLSAVRTAGQWEWAKRPTQMQMGGNENATTAKLMESWWGLDKWSAVLWGGTWDPPQA